MKYDEVIFTRRANVFEELDQTADDENYITFQDEESSITSDSSSLESVEWKNSGGSSANLQNNYMLMILALLEHICTYYTDDKQSSQCLFKFVYVQLTRMKLVPINTNLDAMKAVRAQYSSALVDLMQHAVKNIKRPGIEPEQKLQSISNENVRLVRSWYAETFHEDAVLGNGGFGHVVKARNLLDQHTYAVKKILLKNVNQQECLKTLREVRVFSTVDHKNIVRYHSSWLEHACPQQKRKNGLGDNRLALEDGSQDEEISRSQDHNIEYCSPRLCSHEQSLQMTLYIQMELCSTTMAEWLKQRNTNFTHAKDVDSLTCLKVFKQIVCGVEYIHSLGLLHRDLKPLNIFMKGQDKDLLVKIGDFGLARNNFDPKSPTVDVQPYKTFSGYADVTELTEKGLGTTTYSAPEQKTSSKYTNKVDVYSVGIILFELFRPFSTTMERMKCINALLRGDLCSDVQQRWPLQSEMMLKMTSQDPLNRPSAEEVLKSRLFKDDGEVVTNLLNELKDKDIEITRLKKLLEQSLCLKCLSLNT